MNLTRKFNLSPDTTKLNSKVEQSPRNPMQNENPEQYFMEALKSALMLQTLSVRTGRWFQ